jgi:hypothetical protein
MQVKNENETFQRAPFIHRDIEYTLCHVIYCRCFFGFHLSGEKFGVRLFGVALSGFLYHQCWFPALLVDCSAMDDVFCFPLFVVRVLETD